MLRPLPSGLRAALDHAPPTILGKFFAVVSGALPARGVVRAVRDRRARLPVPGRGNGARPPPHGGARRELPPHLHGAAALALDRAAEHGLRVLITIPWAQHVCFLEDRGLVAEIRGTVRAAAESCGDHPALFGFLVGNEIPPDIVRWYGPERMRDFLRSLRDEVKMRAPAALVSYANFPSTEYLDVTDLVDFVSFNVYLHREADFRRYLCASEHR
jgi:hypothetical protein